LFSLCEACLCCGFQGLNVCVAGAAGGIGQPLSLLLKQSGKFDRLSLFDIVNAPGVAADCSHVNTGGEVRLGCEVKWCGVVWCGVVWRGMVCLFPL